MVDFGSMAARKDLFPPVQGFGPADFVIRRGTDIQGGIFLGKSSSDPDSSAPRMMDLLARQVKKDVCRHY
jgi:hypothetical protein